MHDSSEAPGKQSCSFLERLRRNTIIVVLFSGGLFLTLTLLRQPRLPQQAANDDGRRQANHTEKNGGLGSPSYKSGSHDLPSPPAPLPKAEGRDLTPAPLAKGERGNLTSAPLLTVRWTASPSHSQGDAKNLPSPPAPLPKRDGSHVEDSVMDDLPPPAIANLPNVAQPLERKKLPPPSAAAQEEAGRLIDDIYKISQATTPRQKIALANQLFTLSKSLQVESAERFALLRKTTDLAAEGGDAALMLAAIRQTAGEFDFDSLAAQQQALARVAERSMDAGQAEAFFAAAREAMDQALAAERDGPAQELLGMARQLAKRKEGKDYRPLVARFQAKIARATAHHEEVRGARAALISHPDDPEANRSMAAYYCLAEGDWRHGLACLAKGSDAQVRALAEQDLRSPPGQAEQQMKRAGQWWEVARVRRGPDQDLPMLRAGYWYEQARRGLAEGLLKLAVEQRLGEIAARVAQGSCLRK